VRETKKPSDPKQIGVKTKGGESENGKSLSKEEAGGRRRVRQMCWNEEWGGKEKVREEAKLTGGEKAQL